MANNNLTLELSEEFVEAIDDAKKEVEELVDNVPFDIISFTDAIKSYYDLVDMGVIDEEDDSIDDERKELYTKAVWTTAYKNDLPDSSFLYIKPGCGSKDSEGKTKPRSCRKFPVKDKNGNYDAAHVRNAIARIPQAKGIPPDKKKSLQSRAQSILKKINKEVDMPTEDKSMSDEPVMAYVPWGVYTFADLAKAEDARAKALRIKTLSDQFIEIVGNIMSSDEIENKSAAVSSLSGEYSRLIEEDKQNKQVDHSSWLDGIKTTVKETMDDIFNRNKKQQSGFMLWKENDQLRWLTRYSSNFRDDDNPPEIISAESHRRFVDMVDKKEVPMPELWLWHVPEWRLGKADWLAYDDSGFALASGTIDRGKEIVAEQIAKQKLVGVSHGMPVSSIERDTNDPTVIVKHTTVEISPLPYESAANKMTAWVLLGDTMKEGNNMPIPDRKKQALIDDWKMDPELLDQLESINAQDAEKAVEEGIESKEATEATEEQDTETQETTPEETQPEEEKQADETQEETPPADEVQPPTREEIADAIASVLKPYIEMTKEIGERLDKLEQSDEEKVAKQVSLTPSASVSALLAQKFSVIGDEVAKVDRRKSLAKSKPQETKDENYKQSVGIPFIDAMLAGQPEEDEDAE